MEYHLSPLLLHLFEKKYQSAKTYLLFSSFSNITPVLFQNQYQIRWLEDSCVTTPSVEHNHALFESQWRTVQNSIDKRVRLSILLRTIFVCGRVCRRDVHLTTDHKLHSYH